MAVELLLAHGLCWQAPAPSAVALGEAGHQGRAAAVDDFLGKASVDLVLALNHRLDPVSLKQDFARVRRFPRTVENENIGEQGSRHFRSPPVMDEFVESR